MIAVAAIASARSAESQPSSYPTSAPVHRSIGRVLDKEIFADEIGVTEPIDPNIRFGADNARMWALMGKVQRAFGMPIAERFIREQKCVATDEEIQRFIHGMRERRQADAKKDASELEKLERQLVAPGLSPDARKDLEEKAAMQRRLLDAHQRPALDEVERKIATQTIAAWKFQRDLYRKYGGRIIFQQFGPEALDGMRELYEDAEQGGDLRFDDSGIRHLFYWYFEMKHTMSDDPRELEHPWFLEPSTQPAR
jgi:hypothetical protein